MISYQAESKPLHQFQIRDFGAVEFFYLFLFLTQSSRLFIRGTFSEIPQKNLSVNSLGVGSMPNSLNKDSFSFFEFFPSE